MTGDRTPDALILAENLILIPYLSDRYRIVDRTISIDEKMKKKKKPKSVKGFEERRKNGRQRSSARGRYRSN